MLSIESSITQTTIIQKSKFICRLCPIKSTEEVKTVLENIKHEFVGATHYCYAYIIGNEKRSSDNGEPSGTAGIPILNVLEKNELNYILCVVIRYFGGIKLGAGGLVRAYSGACKSTLDIAKIVELEKGFLVSFVFPYSNEKQMEYLLNKYEIVKKEYQEEINYMVLIPIQDFSLLASNTDSKVEIIEELFIKKIG